MAKFHDFLFEETKKAGKTEAVRALAEEAKKILDRLGLVLSYKLYHNRASGQVVLQWKVANSAFTVNLDFKVGARTAERGEALSLPGPERIVVAKFRQEGFMPSPWRDQANEWFLDIILAKDEDSGLTAWLEMKIPSCKVQE